MQKNKSGQTAEEGLLDVLAAHHLHPEGVSASEAQAFGYLKRRLLNILALGTADALALATGLAFAGVFRMSFRGGGAMIPEWWWFLVVAWVVGAILLGLLPGWGLGAVEELRRTTLLVVGVFGIVAIALFLGKIGTTTSRITLTATMCVAGPLIIAFRNLAKRMLISKGRWGLPMVVYGASDTARVAIRALKEDAGLGFVPVGVFANELVSGHDAVEGVPVLGALAGTTHIAPAALLAMPDTPRHEIITLIEGPLAHYRRVVLIPDLLEAPSLWVQPRDVGGILGLEVSINLLDPFSRLLKRASEMVLVIALAPVWIPVSFIVASLIWIEDRKNPVFKQTRIGKSNHSFHTYKFRTMVPDAEGVLQRALDADSDLRKEWESNFKLRKDPRITRVGRILRRTSLDELPQLYNVLLGQMALVGPRPLPAYHFEELPEQIRNLRLRVRPGVTGLWQVSGRSETGNEGMVRWDGYYVRNWSIWLDIVILVRTTRAVLKGSGAY